MNSLPQICEQIKQAVAANKSITIPLWPEGVPNPLGYEEEDTPTITYYPRESAHSTGTAMVIFPGGSYGSLANHEGEAYAHWFSSIGISAFVVKYRLGRHGYRHPVMLHDAMRAMRLVRGFANEWEIEPTRIGTIGSSAGGHLVSTLITKFDHPFPQSNDPIDQLSARPDIAILCYPVITMGDGTHAGSRKLLLGKTPSQALIDELSSEKHVRDDTPPCFIWHTREDSTVPMDNAIAFANALRTKNLRFELHIYEKGPHGIGLAKNPTNQKPHRWTHDLCHWLHDIQFTDSLP